ncbi:plastocyanin/azurin family copper-binding protein [Aliamphritea hakodatensis]|uniref:plastocyanin/azurin family copper-binding protein n=1 Tax=Aliamphritea hakodatensis TaxID=2895352 RepID=UPI0022FD896A|nr:plastocyanin/azurin family copper-binding protein [Aliamphritea hakodatensis]
MKRLLLPLFVLALNLQPAMAETVHVDIAKFKFSPQQLTINAGDTVVWTNREKRQYHNVWFKDLVSAEPDIFFPDETYQRTFPDAGTFNYICGPHPKMKGSVIVQNVSQEVSRHE